MFGIEYGTQRTLGAVSRDYRDLEILRLMFTGEGFN